MSTNADVLLAAADLLEVDGWQQGSFGPLRSNIPGPRCAAGALICATTELAYAPGSYPCALDALEERLGIIVADWNDQDGQTQANVVAELRATACDLYEAAL
jgi:hypothetical protein